MKPNRQDYGPCDGRRFYAAFRNAADNRENEQAADIVDDSRGQDDAACLVIEQSAPGQNFRADPGTGSGSGGAHENRCHGVNAPERKDGPRKRDGEYDSARGDKCGASADLRQFGRFDFEADTEEKEHHAKVGKVKHEAAGLHPAKQAGADDDTRQNLARDSGQVEVFEQFRQDSGRAEDDEHQQRQRHVISA